MLRARAAPQLLACGALFVGCALPVYQFWPQTEAMLNARLFYLPLMALAPVVAFGGRVTTFATLVVFAVPFLGARGSFYDRGDRSRGETHAMLRAESVRLPPSS